jgi:hypothetical protein
VNQEKKRICDSCRQQKATNASQQAQGNEAEKSKRKNQPKFKKPHYSEVIQIYQNTQKY